MGRLFFLGAFSIVSIISLIRPWIGVVAAYLVVILTPQAVWFWDFTDIRPVLWILVPTCIGAAIALLRGQYELSRLLTSRVLLLATLWLCLLFSYLFGPYSSSAGPFRFTDPAWAFSVLNKMFVLCLLACLIIDETRKIWALAWVLAPGGGYLVYWANDQYLSGHLIGRLAGPVDLYGMGAYGDENNFAMLFVVVQPFLWYLGHAVRQKWLRWGLWLVIPFAWHALFLTASRGGLIGTIVTVLVMTLRSKRRALGFMLLPAFILAYHWQAGQIMKERAQSIDQYQTETSAQTRIEAWHAAIGMIAAHPVSGVGLASFGVAFPDFSDKKPREAHNTFLQIAAESGIVAGLMYLLLGFGSVLALWRNGNRLKRTESADPQERLFLVNEAVLCGMCGFVACSLFLSLQMSEIFFYLCALVQTVLLRSRQLEASRRIPLSDERQPQAIAGRSVASFRQNIVPKFNKLP